MAIPVAALVCITVIAWTIRRIMDAIHIKKRGPYPPGPKPKPFIGNMFDLPGPNSAMEFVQWEKKYNSPLLHAEALGNHILIINSIEDADILFERHERARIYSDRPMMPVNQLQVVLTLKLVFFAANPREIMLRMGWDAINVALMPYGELWRQHRKICHQNFNILAARQYESMQAKKVRNLLQNILDSPEDFNGHNKLYSVSVTIAAMYGYDINSIEDQCIRLSDETLLLGSRLLAPGGSLINVIPALRHIPEWFPGAYSKKIASQVRRLTTQTLSVPLESVKKSFEAGTATSSLVTDFYEKKYTSGASQEEEEIIKNIAYTTYGAASDTTISFHSSFVYAMIVYPDVQRKAHEEIESVIGLKRLPHFADRKSLPYIEAVYREVLRLWPPLPIGLPHALSEDDIYKGYFIPKGTTVFTNIWAMTHNDKAYKDPYEFKPERFFDEQGRLNNDKVLAYGFGRRGCVGRPVASSTVWLMMVSVLAAFNITKASDKYGNDIEINDDFQNDGLMFHKKKFSCSFHPRSLEIRKIIESTA